MTSALIAACEWAADRCLTVAVALRSWRGMAGDFHAVLHLAAARLVTESADCDQEHCRASEAIQALRTDPPASVIIPRWSRRN